MLRHSCCVSGGFFSGLVVANSGALNRVSGDTLTLEIGIYGYAVLHIIDKVLFLTFGQDKVTFFEGTQDGCAISSYCTGVDIFVQTNREWS